MFMSSTSLYKKVKFKTRQIIVILFIRIGLFFHWPRLVAISLWLVSDKINPKCDSQYTVLCMGRSVFADDLEAMAHYSGQIRYVTIWRTYFQNIFYHFIKGPEEEKLEEANYHTHDFCKQGKQNYYLFLKKIFPLLHKLIGFDAVLCGNIGYPDQQEIEKVCAEQKIPYMVLCKESVYPSSTRTKRIDRIAACYKFKGDAMLVYNEEIVTELVRSGFSNMTKDQFKAVGMPRLDRYFDLSKDDRILDKQVLFFSFYPGDKSKNLTDDEEIKKQIHKRAEDFHKWVINFAAKHPDIKVVIKVKTAPHYTEYVKKIFNDNFQQNVKNLEIISIGQVSDLIKSSTAVITFFSTTCFMAIAANKTLITPYFGDLITEKECDYFNNYPELVNYAKTEDELEKYILNPDKYFAKNLASRGEFLQKFLGNCDGRASFRAEEAILEIIKRRLTYAK